MSQQRVKPGPGQESVWDYPRPPRMEDVDGRVKVVFGDVTLAYTTRAKRVLETSHPPVYYIPPEDIRMEHLMPGGRDNFLRVEGPGAVLEHRDRRAERRAGRLELPGANAVLHGPERLRGLLPLEDGYVLGGRRKSRGAGGRLLRRLGNLGDSRSIQGRPRNLGLVAIDPLAGRSPKRVHPFWASGVQGGRRPDRSVSSLVR